MNSYTRIGISRVEEVTKNLTDLNELGIYLSKQTNVNALKILKLIIISLENHFLIKPFNINYFKTSKNINVPTQSIMGNLSKNPQYLALDLMDLLIQSYNCDLNLKITNSESIFDKWIYSFYEIENDQNQFYKRYDLINRKLEIIDFMINNKILNNLKLNFTKDILQICIQNQFDYSNNQIEKMQHIINKIDKSLTFEKNYKDTLNNFNQNHTNNLERKEKFLKELNEFNFNGEQYYYVDKIMPQLIKKLEK